jgi:hypothetical protein
MACSISTALVQASDGKVCWLVSFLPDELQIGGSVVGAGALAQLLGLEHMHLLKSAHVPAVRC